MVLQDKGPLPNCTQPLVESAADWKEGREYPQPVPGNQAGAPSGTWGLAHFLPEAPE